MTTHVRSSIYEYLFQGNLMNERRLIAILIVVVQQLITIPKSHAVTLQLQRTVVKRWFVCSSYLVLFKIDTA